MSRYLLPLAVAAALHSAPAAAQFVAPRLSVQQTDPAPQVRYAAAPRAEMGGGFVEFLFGGGDPVRARRAMPADPFATPGSAYGSRQGAVAEQPRPMDPRYEKQMVSYDGNHAPGTIVIDTSNRFLYLVQDGGKAMRYGIGVGRDGFRWSGVKNITRKAEWPDWTPPPEMLKRRPDLPRHMAGGPDNPLGARAMYLGSTLYRIHGSNEPETIGTAVSSGCIRMRNEDVTDLYDRVKVGTKVVVM